VALIEKTIDIAVPREHFFSALLDVESYPSFLNDVLDTKILSRTDHSMVVEFTVKVIRRITYAVEMKIESPNHLSWVFQSGRLFRKNDGSWKLEAVDATHTLARYTLDMEVNAFVPSAIINKLVSYTLPAMLQEWKAHAEETYGETT